MADQNDFSLDNLNNSPCFNFFNSLSNSELYNDENYDDSPYSNLDVSCKYYDEIQFTSKFQNVKNFSFLSLNIQEIFILNHYLKTLFVLKKLALLLNNYLTQHFDTWKQAVNVVE